MFSSTKLDQAHQLRVVEAFERLCNGVNKAGQGINRAGNAIAGPITVACILGGIAILLCGASWFYKPTSAKGLITD